MRPMQKPDSRALDIIAIALLGIAIQLLLRRYGGINHDASLYLGQALLQRSPDIFGSDLFFLHGSQGRYTLFPLLVAPLFDWISPPAVFMWFTLLGILAFAAASWHCLAGLLPRTQAFWAWLGTLTLPSMYGMVIMFSYDEPFLTPRLPAEALVIMCIGFLARQRWKLAAASLVLAGLFHPLQAIAGGIIVWVWAVSQDRRWLHALWLALPVCGLAFADVKPFDDLFRVADPAWLAELREFNGQLFLLEWGIADYKVIAFDAFLLGFAWRALKAPFGQWCFAALTGLLLGTIASLLLVDVLHLALPAALQLWRVHWLAHWLAMAAVALLLLHDVRSGDKVRALCLVLAGLLAWGITDWVWLVPACLYVAWPRISPRLRPRATFLLGMLLGAGALVLLANYIASEWLPFRVAHYRFELYAFDRRVLAYPLVALGLPLLGAAAWARLASPGRWIIVVAILCPLVMVGAARWDARPPLTLAFERNAMRTDLFGTALPRNAQVYWDSDTMVGTWLILHRANYFNERQLSGLVFNRGTSQDARARLGRILPLMRESLYCQDRSVPPEIRATCRISDESLQLACAPGAAPRADYLVLPYLQDLPPLGSWQITDPATGDIAMTYRLYRCADIARRDPSISPDRSAMAARTSATSGRE